MKYVKQYVSLYLLKCILFDIYRLMLYMVFIVFKTAYTTYCFPKPISHYILFIIFRRSNTFAPPTPSNYNSFLRLCIVRTLQTPFASPKYHPIYTKHTLRVYRAHNPSRLKETYKLKISVTYVFSAKCNIARKSVF